MKKYLIIALAAVMSLSGCSVLQNIPINSTALMSAAGKTISAVSITDAQVIELCQASVAKMDAEAKIDNGSYIKRLNKLMAGVTSIGGRDVNFKVYITDEINAFACGDGSVRVYSGLMDNMTDEEVVAVIGHELGHLVHQDTKNAMKKAYMAAAAVDAVSAVGTIGSIAASTLGDITQSFLNAQFSQKQEYNADEYGFQFAIAQGQSKYSMYRALQRLVQLNGSSSSTSALAQKFSSHPNTKERAAKMLAAAEAYNK